MEILDRFDGLHGKITVVQERTTGARLYLEEGVKQSYVLPGGSAGLDYVRLMGRLLQNASDIALFGCGGGALATELYRCGCRVTVVDDNAGSTDIDANRTVNSRCTLQERRHIRADADNSAGHPEVATRNLETDGVIIYHRHATT